MQLHLIHGRFSDSDEFAEMARGWDLHFRQLEAGPPSGEMSQITAPGILLQRARYGCRYEQRGGSPPGTRTFAILDRGAPGYRWCGRDVGETDIVIFDPRGDYEAVSPPGFRASALCYSEERLAEAAADLGLPELDDLLGDTGEVVARDPDATRELGRSLDTVLNHATREPAALGSTALGRELEVEIPTRLLTALASRGEKAESPSFSVRDLAMKRARSYIEENAEEALTVRDLCRATRVSWRTLNYAFREHLGVAPKAYLRALRLNSVRRELRAGADTVIADVANRWGFWHMGQFAADYRRLFAELPGQTLGPERARAADGSSTSHPSHQRIRSTTALPRSKATQAS